MECLFARYQQKIGTYDKQLWETKIEQREQRIYGLNHIQMRSAKPNTELIDLDLVRGSSFTKAKPQHGFMKVARMATLRWLLMPFYANWWMRQTSGRFFSIILILYIVQMVNIVIYFVYTYTFSYSDFESISCMEVMVPILMAWLLSLIHSQIVATIPDKQKSGRSRKKKQFAEEIDKSGKRRYSRVKNGPLHVQFKPNWGRHKYNKLTPWLRKFNVDDDGFESLVGNGSRTSEEEVAPSEKSEPVNVQNSTTVETSTPVQDEPVAEFVIEDLVNKPEEMPPQEASCVHCSQEQDLDENNSNCTSCLKCENWVKQLGDKVTKKLCCTDSESEADEVFKFQKQTIITKRRISVQHLPTIAVTSVLDSTCDTENEALSSPRDWTAGVTTNSEDCSSDLDDVSDAAPPPERCPDCFLVDGDSNAFLNPPSIKASCTIYKRDEIKKADLSMLDISSIIISKVEATPSTPDYFYAGIVLSTLLTFLPLICRLTDGSTDVKNLWEACKNGSHRFVVSGSPIDAIYVVTDELPDRFVEFIHIALGTSLWERYIVAMAMLQRFIFACMVFFLLAVAERTFKQRLLYAKLFSHLTSSRRARKSALPHFRLNKVRNIKTWLSVRSYLKKRGPQRSVDVIVSTAFVVTLLLLAFLCAELLKETVSFSQYYLEALIWCFGLGVMLLRFITLGTKINKKYRNLSVLITEQINLHLQIEQKPHKKDELTVANNVLKLAIDLLKELENPFKISGLSANPILYNVTKLVILSALSGVLSEMLGFKLKLHKIKLK